LALGYFAGNALTSGTGNTYVGAAAGCAALDGTFNIGVGYQALAGLTTGASNLAIGSLAGNALTTESFNTVVGGHPGLTGVNNHLILADGQGTLRAVINNCGALAPNATDFGTAGQVLTSNGSGSNFYWATPSGGGASVWNTYTTGPVELVAGSPIRVATWVGGTFEGTFSIQTNFNTFTQIWQVYLTGDGTNLNSGWNVSYQYPDQSSPNNWGDWTVDFPVYPDPDNGNWVFYFTPTNNVPVGNGNNITLLWRQLAGNNISFDF
jgi:hypothetical protein